MKLFTKPPVTAILLRSACLTACLSAFITGEATSKEQPNILLVMTDDQGYGDAGFTGHPFVKTPHLDAMAAQGVVFNRFYASALVFFCSDNGGLVEASSGGREKKRSLYEGGLRVPAILEWPARFKAGSIDTPAYTSDLYPTLLAFADAKVEAKDLAAEQPQRLAALESWQRSVLDSRAGKDYPKK